MLHIKFVKRRLIETGEAVSDDKASRLHEIGLGKESFQRRIGGCFKARLQSEGE